MTKVSKEKYALAILERLAMQFPGLIDGDTEVNGADLTEELTAAIENNTELFESLNEIKDTE